MDWQEYLIRWFLDYDFKTFFNTAGSLVITALFALYNLFLGIIFSSAWNWSIFFYYLLLILLRGMMILAERKAQKDTGPGGKGSSRLRRRAYLVGSALLMIMNMCMIGPIAIMVKQLKDVNMKLIPALAMAAYSFYKITIASVNLFRRRRSANCLVKLLRSINFIDALMSIIILQNTLIMVATEGNKLKMMPLTAISSGLIWIAMVILSLSGFIKGIKESMSAFDRT